ncbi:MAG: SAM-dependent methyltransferase [Treponemataceae bacterium]|nr:SAM-dependent methyltransferase [Treponemataceae bacterium]
MDLSADEDGSLDGAVECALYLIPVPLGGTAFGAVLPDGNRRIVRCIRHFIVENLRSARRFLHQLDGGIDIDSLEFYELNEHTPAADVAPYLEPLLAGLPMGVISEAGCPAVADPGAAVVALAHKKHLKVVPLVGPSSILLALMGSGFSGQNFAFNGYLPVKEAERAAAVRKLEQRAFREKQTQIFIEAPYRNMKLFEGLLALLRPETKLCVASGLTCAQERIAVRTVAEWRQSAPPEMHKVPAIFLLYC